MSPSATCSTVADAYSASISIAVDLLFEKPYVFPSKSYPNPTDADPENSAANTADAARRATNAIERIFKVIFQYTFL